MAENELGNRLKECRIKKKLKQTDVAKRLNIGEKTLRNYEKGQDVTVSFIKKFSKEFDIDLNWLMTGEEKKNIEIKNNTNNSNIGNNNNIVNGDINGNININTSEFNHGADIKEIIDLLQYAPSEFLNILKERLKKFKELTHL